jgi:aspartyl protease family protein
MSGAFGLGLLLFGATALVMLFADKPIAGLPPSEFAIVAGLSAAALLVTSRIVAEFRLGWAGGARALLGWSVVLAGIVTAYVRRDDLQGVVDRMIGEVSPGRTVANAAGDVVVARRADGSFTVAGRINNREARFIFDTGATAVVLTAESAAATGFDLETLNYSIPVSTANGRTMTAPISIDSLAIGTITERRVQALVAKPGVLRENLLGMTFLDRLGSYEVRGNRLILRPRP